MYHAIQAIPTYGTYVEVLPPEDGYKPNRSGYLDDLDNRNKTHRSD